MTMTTKKLGQHFIASIERAPRFSVPTEELGWLLVTFPVVGGGVGCIVLRVEDRIVRLSEHGGLWIAEELVAREREEG